MKYVKTKSEIIEKALKKEVTTENIGEKLEIEDIIYLNGIKSVMNYYSIESVLQNYISLVNIDEKYKAILNAKSLEENYRKDTLLEILRKALREIPNEIEMFISTFLADVLYNKFNLIKQKSEKIKNDPDCVNYIRKYEKKLGFDDVMTKISILQYMKKKYSSLEDYYNIDLIYGYTNSVFMALIYILYE